MLLRACFSDKHICELQQKMVGTEKFRQSTGAYNHFISLNETNLPKVSHNSYHISVIFFILQHLTFPKHLVRKVIYSCFYFLIFLVQKLRKLLNVSFQATKSSTDSSKLETLTGLWSQIYLSPFQELSTWEASSSLLHSHLY